MSTSTICSSTLSVVQQIVRSSTYVHTAAEQLLFASTSRLQNRGVFIRVLERHAVDAARPHAGVCADAYAFPLRYRCGSSVSHASSCCSSRRLPVPAKSSRQKYVRALLLPRVVQGVSTLTSTAPRGDAPRFRRTRIVLALHSAATAMLITQVVCFVLYPTVVRVGHGLQSLSHHERCNSTARFGIILLYEVLHRHLRTTSINM